MFNLLKYYKFPLVLVVSCCALYFFFAYDLDRRDFPRLLCLYLALFILSSKLFQMERANFRFLTASAFLFRAVFLFSLPNLSQDFYRFLWDGKLVLEGINPYLETPAEMLRLGIAPMDQAGELVEGMGSLSAGNTSNYPPLTQLLFAIAAFFSGKSILGGVIAIRIMILSADIGILFFGRKLLKRFSLPENRIFWYLLNPFVLIEFTGNLHFEGIMIFLLLGSLYLLIKGRTFWSGVLFALSVSVKLIPLIFLPLLFLYFHKRPFSGRTKNGLPQLFLFYSIVATVNILLFLPYLTSGFFLNYTESISLWFQKFEFNASFYYLVRWMGFQAVGYNIIGWAGGILAVLVFLLVVGLAFLRRNQVPTGLFTSMLFAVSIYFLLATTVHPWYLATPLVLGIFTRYRFALLWPLVAVLSYHTYSNPGFQENLWLVSLEYILLLGFLGFELIKKAQHERTTATG